MEDLGRQMQVQIPIKLTSYNKTQGAHWSKNYKRKKGEQLVIWSYLTHYPRPPLPCHVTITRVSPRPLDLDNFMSATKYVTDTIADWLIPDKPPGHADSDPRITWTYAQEKGKPTQYDVRIEISWQKNAEGDMPIAKHEDPT